MPPVHTHRSARTLILLATLGVLGGCEGSFLQPAGSVARAERLIFLDALVIMLAIVVPVIIATLAVAWWFRASNPRARYRPDWTYSGRVELVVWSIPALVVFFLGGIAWISAHDLDPAEPLASETAPLEIDVVSLDWKWLFIYPAQGVASVNRLVVPAGVPLRFRVTSATVWNALWIPRLGSMLYCMYGMVGTLYLQAEHPGRYLGMSAMISGDGFAGMHFDTDALAPQQFDAWTRTTRAAGPVLDDTAYRALLRPTSSVAPYSYRSVTPGLFQAIVSQQLPPGTGAVPSNGQLSARQ
jgi:cytochrome o ubiquinol oxidase subunit II